MMATDDVTHPDDRGLVIDDMKHKTMEAPGLTTSSSEISVPEKASSKTTVPVLTIAPGHAPAASKKNCDSFARYMAGFWLVRTALGLTDSALCFIAIIAQTLGTPLQDPLNMLRRSIRSVLDEPVESLATFEPVESLAVMDEPVENHTVIDEPLESLAVMDKPEENHADAEVSSNTDLPIASNRSPNEDANISVNAMDDKEGSQNPVDVKDEPILKTEFRESVESTIMTDSKPNMSIEGTEFENNKTSGVKRSSDEHEAVIDQNGPKTTEVLDVKDFEEASTNHKNMEEFEEEVLRKSFAQAVKDVEPFKLKIYEKRIDDIVDNFENWMDDNNVNNMEECDIEATGSTDDFKHEDDMSGANSYCKGFSLDEPSTQSSFSQDHYCPLLLEQTFLGPPAPTSARRYPGFRHLFVYEPYQMRYGSLGPVVDLVDDLITGAVQLSSSGATSIRDDPADYPLPDDTFDSSFESNEF